MSRNDELARLDREVFMTVEQKLGFSRNQLADIFEAVANEYEKRCQKKGGRSSLIESLRKHAKNARF